MKGLTIELPAAEFRVRAPTDVLESLRLFYPRSLSTSEASRAVASFCIRPDDGAWLLSRDDRQIGSFSDPTYALLALEFEIENAVVKGGAGRLALHAGCVVTQGGAWLIAGHPDTGKTSSTFHLLELGQSFLCEEIALYEPATRRVLPYLQTLSLDREFLADYQDSFSVESGELIALDSHITRFIPQRMSESAAALEVVLLPRYRPGEPPSVETLAAESVLAEFLGYCYPPRSGEEELFDAVIELLETTRLYRITYGSAAAARGLLQRLLELPVSAS